MWIRIVVRRRSFWHGGTGGGFGVGNRDRRLLDWQTGARSRRGPRAIAAVEGLEFKADESETMGIAWWACAPPSTLSLGFAACLATGNSAATGRTAFHHCVASAVSGGREHACRDDSERTAISNPTDFRGKSWKMGRRRLFLRRVILLSEPVPGPRLRRLVREARPRQLQPLAGLAQPPRTFQYSTG